MALRRVTRFAVLAVGFFLWAPSAKADVLRGIMDVLSGVLVVPLSTLEGTFSGPPVIGTAFGALNGVVNGVSLVAQGAFELAASAVPIAKALAPFLPFLL